MKSSPQLHRSLIPLETTFANLADEEAAVALVNFAALFHEKVALTDTVLGDHRLLIESSSSTNSASLYNTVMGMVDAGILTALYRDKVVVRASTVSADEPTLRDIYAGWQLRDRKEWNNKSGITSSEIDPQLRLRYYDAIHEALARNNAIMRYDPDETKKAFREAVRIQLGKHHGILSTRIGRLPRKARRDYECTLKDEWFTYAEVWRALRPYLADENMFNDTEELLHLHAHLNQQQMANAVAAGQSLQGYGRAPIAAFHRELVEELPALQTVEAHLDPPENLHELLDQALVRLDAPSIRLIAQFSVDEIINLRKHGKSLVALANRPLLSNALGEVEILRRDYVRELGKYWEHIIEAMEKKTPNKLIKYPMTIWMEEHAPKVHDAFVRYGKPVETMLLRLGKNVPGAGLFGGIAIEGLHHLGAVVFQENTDLNQPLRSAVPPREWVPRGFLGLEPTIKSIGKANSG
jgi:hypothetical protein